MDDNIVYRLGLLQTVAWTAHRGSRVIRRLVVDGLLFHCCYLVASQAASETHSTCARRSARSGLHMITDLSAMPPEAQ